MMQFINIEKDVSEFVSNLEAVFGFGQALAVSDAVYSSKWYSYRFSRLKATLLLMIQNSQNGITIKAGGLVTINADTIVKVLRVAWSACSILRGLRQN
ncbi:hypothetical protein ILUMI_17827 [Ignelater luminosus]|uniref:Uncharacterized protein n=1 Tax=Ignelater luminosus TaxID=2038154 RepID=A0A8K0G760_IGNLU|nr:hypothetical protein ILUMI_17827 [Ignelater luminosus]